MSSNENNEKDAVIKISDNFPESVEEAGALLGAAMTRYNVAGSTASIIAPPAGIPSSLSLTHPLPGSELFTRLYALRALLRNSNRDQPLVAAPSLLAGVLLKLLGISSSLASSPSTSSNTPQSTPQQVPPPLLSTGMRKLWVDCVVLCHDLGDGLSAGQLKMNLFGFCRNMMALAAMNPKSARATGGARVAALEVMSGLLLVPKLASQLSSWAYDILVLCQKAMKSSGTGEPSYRIAALRLACAVAKACRDSSLKLKPKEGTSQLVLKGALEDKAIVEAVKLVKLSVADKIANVREVAAELASHLGPLLIHTSIKTQQHPDGVALSPTAALEDVLTLCLKNIDDESAHVAGMWAQALARCLCTSIEYGSQVTADKMSDRNVESGESGASMSSSSNANSTSGRRGVVSTTTCSTLPATLKFLVGMFVKSGGEATAPKAGGLYSVGGRAVRVGLSRALMHILQVQLRLGGISESEGVSMKDALLVILTMVGNEFQEQLNSHDDAVFSETLDATSVVTPEHLAGTSTSKSAVNPLFAKNLHGNPLFSAMQAPKKSHADSGVARTCTSRVLREGLSVMAPESLQLVLLHELIQMSTSKKLNANQLQIIWIELSHLLTTLGEASATAVEEIWPSLKDSLKHENHGVRHEAAIAGAALAAVFPAQGRLLIKELVTDLQLEHAELMKLGSASPQQSEMDSGSNSDGPGARLMRFGRRTPQKEQPRKQDDSFKHQYALHGMSLALSILVRDLPSLPGGVPSRTMETDIFPIAEQFVSMQFNNVMANNNPSITCTCVRAGYALVCGALTAGPSAISNHISLIFGLWQKTSKFASKSKRFTPSHELLCIDAMLTSIVTFLKYSSELLLSVPDALSRISLLLEELVPLLVPQGRLGKPPENPAANSRLETAKASLMESFAWLPPGSYPMVADNMFSFAASQIREAIENDTSCSIIRSLVNKEDRILDATSFSNAVRPGQVAGAHDLADDILLRTSEVAHHGERESVLYFHDKTSGVVSEEETTFRGSTILGEFAYDNSETEAPTALHEVGTWQLPVEPSCSSKIRLIDASIQIFAATFVLKNGKDQKTAIEMLETLVPPKYSQLAKNMGVTTALVDSADRRSKQSKEDSAAVDNIVAVLLACLQTLPLQESTHNVTVGLGPAWMGKAKDLLLTFLPSGSNIVRRAASEGLALLSTLGANEDAQFLQSAVLYSLDEIMRGNQHDGKPTPAQTESISVARAGSLLTIASIQRTSQGILEKRNTRARTRSVDGKIEEEKDDKLPAFQMMTRILPSIKNFGPRDFFVARTSALHSFALLVGYSNRILDSSLRPEDLHLLKKAIELVEGNLLSAWTLAANDFDRGDEKEKLEYEPSFLSVSLRLMTFLVPSLHHTASFDSYAASRFCMMASVILECYGSHPAVAAEAMAFFEVMSLHQQLLPAPSDKILYSDNMILSFVPFVIEGLTPERPSVHATISWDAPAGCHKSFMGQLAFLRLTKRISRSHVLLAELTDMKIVSTMLAAFESISGMRCFSREVYYRSLAAPRESEVGYRQYDMLEQEISEALRLILYSELDFSRTSTQILLRWILLSKVLMSGTSSGDDEFDDESPHNATTSFSVESIVKSAMSRASSDSQPIFSCSSPPRWQVKNVATQLATTAIIEIDEGCRYHGVKIVDSPDFNPALAKIVCQKEFEAAKASGIPRPGSLLAFHVNDLVVSACSACTATVDQSELQILQNSAMHLLVEIINCFGPIENPEDPKKESILGEYIPQLSSCIKTALVATNERHGEISSRLFLVGCEALHSFIRTNVTNDNGVLKRTIRSSLPEADSVPFFNYKDGLAESFFTIDEDQLHLNHRTSLLVRIGQLWSLGNLPLDDAEIMGMVKAGKAELCVNAASIAIDGASLLLGSNLSLGGIPVPPAGATPSIQQGMVYENINDIDDSVKAGLVKTWASCASSSAYFLSTAIESGDIDQEKKDGCLTWIKPIASLLFAGFRDSLAALSVNTPKMSIVEWARGVDATDVAVNCLKGISSLAAVAQKYDIHDQWTEEFENLIAEMTDQVLLPTLVQGNIQSSKGNIVRLKQRGCQSEIADCACDLLKRVSGDDKSSAILVALLSPLELVQDDGVNLDDKLNAKIVASCIGSVTGLIGAPDGGKSSLGKVMLPLAVKILSDKKATSNAQLQAQGRDLLRACLDKGTTSEGTRSQIATEMANAANWEAWAVVCSLDDATTATESLSTVKRYLANCSNLTVQLEALSAIKGLAAARQPPNDLIGRVVFSVCPEVLCMMASFATLNVPTNAKTHRTAVSADCMKIALVALGQVQADGSSDEIVVGFLTVLFETFITVLRFNGIPNHPKPQAQSDPAIGRMCAQAMLHVARTSPDPFKTCLANLADHDRAVVEFAVRGEMSGYATQSSAPAAAAPKKVISLKGFKQ